MFEISEIQNNEFQFVLKAQNGQIVLRSGDYSSVIACENGIEVVKKFAPRDSNFQRLISSEGYYYFILKADNGQIIGISLYYESETARDNGIESVKKNSL